MSSGLDLRVPDLRGKSSIIFELHMFDLLRKLTIIGDFLNQEILLSSYGEHYQRPFCNIVMCPCHTKE